MARIYLWRANIQAPRLDQYREQVLETMSARFEGHQGPSLKAWRVHYTTNGWFTASIAVAADNLGDARAVVTGVLDASWYATGLAAQHPWTVDLMSIGNAPDSDLEI